MPKYQTALVTGGAGFIGSHIVDALVRKRIKTYVVDDLSTGQKSNLNPNAHFTKLSITSPQFIAYVKRVKPDVIFHCAAQINLRTSITHPIEDAQINIIGTLHVVQAAIQSQVKKIIFSSTGGPMYAQTERLPVSEKSPAVPVAPYGIAKRTAEQYLRFAYEVFGIPYVALRYSNVYGPRQNAKGDAGVITLFADHMLRGEPITIFGSGKQTRDYVFVEDVARANMLAMSRSVVGEFNIATGKQTELLSLVKQLITLTGYQLPPRFEPAIPGEVMKSALNAKKAKEFFDWSPKMKFSDGLVKTVQWIAAQTSSRKRMN